MNKQFLVTSIVTRKHIDRWANRIATFLHPVMMQLSGSVKIKQLCTNIFHTYYCKQQMEPWTGKLTIYYINIKHGTPEWIKMKEFYYVSTCTQTLTQSYNEYNEWNSPWSKIHCAELCPCECSLWEELGIKYPE